jgi:hypothetical protein
VVDGIALLVVEEYVLDNIRLEQDLASCIFAGASCFEEEAYLSFAFGLAVVDYNLEHIVEAFPLVVAK